MQNNKNKSVVNRSSLIGKVMCGYQGWFTAEGDGANRGFHHWSGRNGFKPGSCSIDLWPDLTDFSREERYSTPFRHADGSVAEVFSSFNGGTVKHHFEWMQEYGIDGVFVQRFITEVGSPQGKRHFDTVLENCRKYANQFGRSFAIMYDLSGLPGGQRNRVIEDWKALVDRGFTRDAAYQRHRGKPVLAIWGFGFNDGRQYTIADGIELLKFVKDAPRYGGNTVMLGVPSRWRTLTADSVNDPALHTLIQKADIVSPWSVGRFGTPEGVQEYARDVWKPDIEWCKKNNLDYLPVVFPGFSWHNLKRDAKPNQIPRLGGRFLWEQYVQAKQAGAVMVYQAMFDEVDEGTAIFKCTNNPPVGESSFISYEGLPSDYYLRLVGIAGQMIRDEIKVTKKLPYSLSKESEERLK